MRQCTNDVRRSFSFLLFFCSLPCRWDPWVWVLHLATSQILCRRTSFWQKTKSPKYAQEKKYIFQELRYQNCFRLAPKFTGDSFRYNPIILRGKRKKITLIAELKIENIVVMSFLSYFSWYYVPKSKIDSLTHTQYTQKFTEILKYMHHQPDN